MKVSLFFLALLLFVQIGFSQSKSKIDSINNIVVQEIKIPLDELIEIFKQNIEDAQQLNYQEGKAEALSKLATAYNYRGDSYDKETEAMLSAIRIYESLGNKKKMAELYGGFGWVMKRRNLKNAMSYMQKGINIAQDNAFTNQLKDLYNNYGVLKQWNKEVDSAIYYFEEGLKIKRDTKDDFGIPYSLSNLAGAYLVKKEHQTASSLLKESIELRKVLKDSVGLGENFTQLAEVYYDEGKYDDALELFKKSVKIALDKEYRNLEQFNYNYISDIYQKQNQVDSALHYYKKYIEVKDQMFTETQEAKISELTIAYETEKKELALAESKIQLQRRNLQLYLSLAGILLLSLVGYFIYNQQKLRNLKLKKEMELKTALAKIEIQNKLEEQRLRISRDLHDNIGSQLTFVISSLQYIQYKKKINIEDIKNRVNDIGNFTQQTIHELRDTIWAMNKEEIALSDLISRLKNFVNQLNIEENISVEVSNSIESKMDDVIFSALDGIHVYRIIQESINNAIKHADANSISISFYNENDILKISISDNGIGFDTELVKSSNGLKNLKKRADKLKAQISIDSVVNKGTEIQLLYKLG